MKPWILPGHFVLFPARMGCRVSGGGTGMSPGQSAPSRRCTASRAGGSTGTESVETKTIISFLKYWQRHRHSHIVRIFRSIIFPRYGLIKLYCLTFMILHTY